MSRSGEDRTVWRETLKFRTLGAHNVSVCVEWHLY